MTILFTCFIFDDGYLFFTKHEKLHFGKDLAVFSKNRHKLYIFTQNMCHFHFFNILIIRKIIFNFSFLYQNFFIFAASINNLKYL